MMEAVARGERLTFLVAGRRVAKLAYLRNMLRFEIAHGATVEIADDRVIARRPGSRRPSTSGAKSSPRSPVKRSRPPRGPAAPSKPPA